jgi:hypothetical protein
MGSLLRRIRYWIDDWHNPGAAAEEIETHRALTEAALGRAGLCCEAAARASRRMIGNITLARKDASR